MPPFGWYSDPLYGAYSQESINDVYRKARIMMIVRKTIDLKHHVEAHVDLEKFDPKKPTADIVNVYVVKTGNNKVIEDHEPLILFRGRDHLAAPLLRLYRTLCEADGCNDFQLGQVDELIDRFHRFIRDYPEQMKQPGITRGL